MKTCRKTVLQSLNCRDLATRRNFHRAIFMYRSCNNLLPPELCSTFQFQFQSEIQKYKTRSKDNLRFPKPKTNWAKSAVKYVQKFGTKKKAV